MTSPAWSVIVPTYNRPEQLARCLTALTQLDPPMGGFEVIVVNDGGADFDEKLRRSFDARSAPRVRLLSRPHGGPGAARDHAAEVAAGAWLAFTDDDCEPETGWLLGFERALAAQPDALAGGVVLNVVENVFAEASQVLVNFVTSWFDGVQRERMFTTNNIALARSAFLAAGGFDATFGRPASGEDREFCDRWFAQGRPSCTVADAIVRHSHVMTMPSFVRQHFNYGRAGRLFRRKRNDGGRPIRVDPGFYFASLRHAAGMKPFTRGAQLVAWTAVAHAAYVAGFVRETIRQPDRLQ